MGANTTAKRLRGYTLSAVKDVVGVEYEEYLRTGKQYGVLNLIGPAGIGKTESIYQIAKAMREKGYKACEVVELYLSALMDPESAAGTPIPIDYKFRGKQVKALSLASRTEILEAMNLDPDDLTVGKPIMFIDEMGREADQLRPLIMKLLHEKKLGGLDVNDFFIIVAGNPSDEEHNAVAIQEDAALSSRLFDIPVKPDVKELGKYFYNKDFTQSHRTVADFLMENPEYMHGRDTQDDQSSKFHSPRTWFNAAWKLHIHGGGNDQVAGDVKATRVSMVLTGGIGPQAYTHFKNFCSLDKPLSVKDVLSHKWTAPLRSVPPSTQQALKTWLDEQDITNQEADNLVEFLDAIPMDLARSVMREAQNGNIKMSNQKKLVSRGVFQKFIDRATRIKAPGTTP